MSFIKEPTAESIDTFRAGNLLTDVRVTDEQADAAWAQLRRRGALDLAPMLGIGGAQ